MAFSNFSFFVDADLFSEPGFRVHDCWLYLHPHRFIRLWICVWSRRLRLPQSLCLGCDVVQYHVSTTTYALDAFRTNSAEIFMMDMVFKLLLRNEQLLQQLDRQWWARKGVRCFGIFPLVSSWWPDCELHPGVYLGKEVSKLFGIVTTSSNCSICKPSKTRFPVLDIDLERYV